ncbi:MAG: hypothetical protein IH849_12175, partial [Acidobacteria bacterium]|nr:hypothetical protein [Acidobacteriota bacterium]
MLPPYRVDVSGNGQVGPADAQIIRAALHSRRGFNLTPAPGYDFRADVFGRGSVDQLDISSVEFNVPLLQGIGQFPDRRPITVAWHYGWYDQPGRPPLLPTAQFLTGNYASWDPVVEGQFNELKNEFGITVDALSWITPIVNPRLENNYRAGYLKAPHLATRHVALLYESTISLPGTERIDFVSTDVRGRLVGDFGHMGRFMAEIRDTTPARLFMLDGRPVMFIFGTHSWGLGPGFGFEFDAMDVAIKDAINNFANAFGQPPYLVGEEVLLSPSDEYRIDRFRRSANFDAIFHYHHASSQQQVIESGGFLGIPYALANKLVMQRVYATAKFQRNRFTGRRLLVIPSLAPGFAKLGLMKLLATKGSYADFMKLTMDTHMKEYLEPFLSNELGTPVLPAPVYTVGSGNEEFEGNAVFPAAF